MNEQQVLEVLEKVGAFRSGHFVLTSGLHSDSYILKDAMYAFTRETSQICKAMAERFQNAGIEAVIGPAIGAAILAQWVAYHLSELTGSEVSGVFAEKDGTGGFIIKRGYDKLISGKKTLVVEDLTTTGGSIKKVVEAARACSADIRGAIAICNRGGVKSSNIGNPPEFVSMVEVALESWGAGECELCEKGIPVNTDVGHGREFLSGKK